MRVKRVPLQDLELWPDEVICFTAYTDTRNPVQQRRTYVDGSRYAELQVENAKLRDLMYEKAHEHSIQHMTEDELRIMATSLMSENEKLREHTKWLESMLLSRTEYYEDLVAVMNAIRDKRVEIGIEADE